MVLSFPGYENIRLTFFKQHKTNPVRLKPIFQIPIRPKERNRHIRASKKRNG